MRDPKQPITDVEIYDALIHFQGNVSRVAGHFSVRRGTIRTRIDKQPELVALMEDFREELVDQAEENQRVDVQKGDPTASRFVLSTIGKERGWSAGVSGTGKNGSIVVELRSFDGDGVKNA